MQKVKNFKCPVCKKVFQSLKAWSNHMLKDHPEVIPEGWTPARYFYYIQTGKSGAQCVICKNPTEWNESTCKYERFCTNPKCKEEYKRIFRERMINRYGKVTLLNDPEQQRKMLLAKKNSGYYNFPGGKVEYASSYELDFLKMLDTFLHLSNRDIMGPSPHTYYYDYKNPKDKENEGRKFYIPDYYIPSLNLEIEIKQNTSTHPKILMIDKVKEELKDKMMLEMPGIRYIKIVDKDYREFFKLLIELQETMPVNDIVEDPVTESARLASNTTTLTDLKKLYNKIKDYKYGALDTNGKIIPWDNTPRIFNLYRTLTPEQFKRSRGGICFDYAAYEYSYLVEQGYVPSVFFITPSPKPYQTHSFVVLKADLQYYYIEASFLKIAGVHAFDTLEDVFDFVSKAIIEDAKLPRNTKFIKYDITSKLDMLYGLRTSEYIDTILSKFTPYTNTMLSTAAESVEFSPFIKSFKKKSFLSLDTLTNKVLSMNDRLDETKFPNIRYNSKTFGEVFYKDGKLVCYYMTERKQDDKVWVIALEVLPEFMGHQLSRQLLSRALDRQNAEFMSVNKKNAVMNKILLKSGATQVRETDFMNIYRLII